ncbi:hypothetical protein K488DRAFT_74391 [Vararia minispora EC-137]|uniref:Uncharacterized protein n=1 Tax=Vararia minispora EC-137 TaxID=1314806 RepID=A0ACB8Q8S8_9AGAM|nr:hypothetical protein K488DRAFT_74391 [Vararia minispora EC-137]
MFKDQDYSYSTPLSALSILFAKSLQTIGLHCNGPWSHPTKERHITAVLSLDPAILIPLQGKLLDQPSLIEEQAPPPMLQVLRDILHAYNLNSPLSLVDAILSHKQPLLSGMLCTLSLCKLSSANATAADLAVSCAKIFETLCGTCIRIRKSQDVGFTSELSDSAPSSGFTW